MRLDRIAAAAALLAAGAPTLAAQTPAAPGAAADLVLLNGKIFIGDSAGTTVQAIAVRGGHIVVAGRSDQAQRVAGEGTRVVDLHGALVTPGFNDAHIHIAEGGGALLEADLTGATSLAEIERRVREAASRTAPGEWVQGRGWDQTRLPPSELGPGGWPTREALDRAAPNSPVVLSRVDGHTSWANSAALRIAGITRSTPNPPGGEIVRDPRTGEATGILREGPARGLVTTRVPSPGPAQIRRQLVAAMELAARYGVTSVQTDVSPITSGSFDENDPALPAAFRAFQELERADSLTFRVYAWVPLTREFIAAFRRLGIRAPYGDEWLRLGLVKGYTDGSLGSRSAYMLAPYSDAPGTRGLPQHSDAGLDSLVDAADAAGLQVILHAIGDAANRQALDAFEHASRVNPPHERRHRIEHAQIVCAPGHPALPPPGRDREHAAHARNQRHALGRAADRRRAAEGRLRLAHAAERRGHDRLRHRLPRGADPPGGGDLLGRHPAEPRGAGHPAGRLDAAGAAHPRRGHPPLHGGAGLRRVAGAGEGDAAPGDAGRLRGLVGRPAHHPRARHPHRRAGDDGGRRAHRLREAVSSVSPLSHDDVAGRGSFETTRGGVWACPSAALRAGLRAP